jgi:DNA-binding PadR family transcriptional regulator
MPIELTAKEIDFLKQLEAAGDRGRTISAPTLRGGLKRLVDAGYVVDEAVSSDAVLYRITKLGPKALADA